MWCFLCTAFRQNIRNSQQKYCYFQKDQIHKNNTKTKDAETVAIIRFKNTMHIICCLTAGSLQLERGAVVVSEAFNTSAATYPITAP